MVYSTKPNQTFITHVWANRTTEMQDINLWWLQDWDTLVYDETTKKWIPWTWSSSWDVTASWLLTDDLIVLWWWNKVVKTSSKGITTNLWTDDTTLPTSKAVKDALDLKLSTTVFTSQNQLTKEPTWFNIPWDVIINYDPTTQKITLTWTWKAYYRWVEVIELTSWWVSAAHTNTVWHTYFLYYDWTFKWATDTFPWFDNLLIAVVIYRTNDKFAIRECHGLQPWQCHQSDHLNLWTYRTSWWDISWYTPRSTTAANRRPDVSACTIWDEDLPTINALLNTKLYSQRYMSGTVSVNYTLWAANIVPLSGNNPYYNPLSWGNYVQTLMPANSMMTVWLYEVPVTASATSQQYRHVFVQWQSITQAVNSGAWALTTAYNTEILKQPSDLFLWEESVLSPEYVCIHKFIIEYTGWNWNIRWDIKVTWNRTTQSQIASWNFLTSVTTDSTLTWAWTVASPLSVPSSVSWLVWTKSVTETDIWDDKILVYKTASWTLVYEAKPTAWWSNPIYEIQIAWEQAAWSVWRFVSKWTQTIAWVKISLWTLPTWSNFIVDVRKNWTATTNSIFTSDTPISITTWQSATNWIYITTWTSIDNGSLVENDVLYVVITTVWSTLSWTNFECVIY